MAEGLGTSLFAETRIVIFKQCIEVEAATKQSAVKVLEQVPTSCRVQDPFGSFIRLARKVCKLVAPLFCF